VVHNYQKKNKEDWYNYYTQNLARVNCWDLVDATSHQIVGNYLKSSDQSILRTWIEDKNPWIRRVAIVSCFEFIRNNDFTMIMDLAKLACNDPFDLNHKAAGWMLREVGKKDT
jgi:3-methyladenine DNA glycosylase AlkD